MLRLVAYRPDGVSRFPLIRGEQLVGSSDECEIFLPFPGVAERHAMFRRGEQGLEIETMSGAPSVVVNGSPVRRIALEALDEVRLGNVVLLVEDTRSALPAALGGRPEEAVSAGTPVADPRSLLDWLSRLSGWVVSDSESRASLESLLRGLLVDFGGGAFYLFQGSLAESKPAVRLSVVTEERLPNTTEDEEEMKDVNSAEGHSPQHPSPSVSRAPVAPNSLDYRVIEAGLAATEVYDKLQRASNNAAQSSGFVKSLIEQIDSREGNALRSSSSELDTKRSSQPSSGLENDPLL